MWDTLGSQIFSISFIIVTLRFMTPILLSALGGLISDIAGVNNIGLEGLMLMSAFSSIAINSATGSWGLGVLAGVCSGVMLSYVIGFFSIKMRVDVVIAGLAINIFGSGFTIFLMSKIYGLTGNYSPSGLHNIPNINIPFISNIPILGRLLNGHNLMVWIAIIAVAFCVILIYYTPYGVHLRSVGESPDAAKSVGIPVKRIQYSALAWSGLFTGLSGAFLSTGITSMFVKDMTAGTGYLALAVVLLGNRHPIGVFIGSIIFGLASALTTIVQTIPGNQFPSQFIQMIPYVVTILALVVFAIRKKRRLARISYSI
jgi:general nucleoside transport system permease protein